MPLCLALTVHLLRDVLQPDSYALCGRSCVVAVKATGEGNWWRQLCLSFL
jgi:hypothetical protein